MIYEKKKTAVGAGRRLKYLGRTLVVLQIIAVLIVSVRMAFMNILPAGYMIACIIAMLTVCALLWLATGKKVFTLVVIIVSLLMICLLFHAFAAMNRLDDTLKRVSSEDGQETVQMAVITLADASANELTDCGGSKIGCIRNDITVPGVKKVIDDANAFPAVYTEYDDVLTLAEALLNGMENVIILNREYIDMISEQDNYTGFSEKVKILYVLEVNVPVSGAETKSGGKAETEPGMKGDGQESYMLSSDEKTIVIYVSGIDTFGSINVKSRSDVNILIALNMETGQMQLINTPRDYYVILPGKGADKLTHGGLYGVECSKEVLENLYGITIDYYLRINFSGFEDIIDLMGGIDVFSAYDFTVEPIRHYTVGYNHLSGIEALAFARERYSFAEGDVQRGTNQMEVIKAVISKAASADILVNYQELLEEVSECFQTDMPPEVIYDLVRYQLSNNVTWKIDSFTVRGTGSHETTYSIPGTTSYVMLPDNDDVAEARRLIENVMAGDMLPTDKAGN